MSKTIKQVELDDRALASLILSQKKIDKEDINKEFQKNLPIDLIKYRFIMHPVRLTMLKLLYLENNLSSTEIKHLLDISWGVYGTHIKSLKERGFIITEEIFDDAGALTNIVRLTELGQSEYEDLLKLLREFIDHDSVINTLISGNEKELFRNDLYPK